MPAPAASSAALSPAEAANILRAKAEAADDIAADAVANAYRRAAEIVERIATPPAGTSGGGRLLLSQREAAQMLGMAVGTVNTMVNAGKIPVVRLSEGTARIPRAWLEKHISDLVDQWERRRYFQMDSQEKPNANRAEKRRKYRKSSKLLAES